MFFPLPALFSRGFLLRIVKSRNCVLKSYRLQQILLEKDLFFCVLFKMSLKRALMTDVYKQKKRLRPSTSHKTNGVLQEDQESKYKFSLGQRVPFQSSYMAICFYEYPFGQCFSLSLTHYQTTNFRLVQTERVCRQRFQIWRKLQKAIQTGRKHCGKRRNCSLWAISPFPTVFSKGLFPRGVKRCHCVGMG